jgi:hypothetical protein
VIAALRLSCSFLPLELCRRSWCEIKGNGRLRLVVFGEWRLITGEWR